MLRRVRHLSYCDYVVPITQKNGQSLALCGEANVLLERPYHQDLGDAFELSMHAKFNSNAMNGVQLMANLTNRAKAVTSVAVGFYLYRVNEASWTETLVSSVVPTTSGTVHTAYVSQATLGANELSGRECYAFECVLTRVRKQFKRKVYFNHLGSYDHLIMLRQSVEWLEIAKVDD